MNLLDSSNRADAPFAVGERVVICGCLVNVVAIRPDGLLELLDSCPGGSFAKWVADPAKCRRVENPELDFLPA